MMAIFISNKIFYHQERAPLYFTGLFAVYYNIFHIIHECQVVTHTSVIFDLEKQGMKYKRTWKSPWPIKNHLCQGVPKDILKFCLYRTATSTTRLQLSCSQLMFLSWTSIHASCSIRPIAVALWSSYPSAQWERSWQFWKCHGVRRLWQSASRYRLSRDMIEIWCFSDYHIRVCERKLCVLVLPWKL